MAKRTDANQQEIMDALRDVGCSVFDLHEVGHGCPDLLVGRCGENYLLEVKMPRGRITDDEADWHLTWHGQVDVVRSVEAALRAVGLWEVT